MKNRTNKILLAIFLLSRLLYGLIVSIYLEIIPTARPDWLYTVFAWLALGFHAVPAFCLQLLLCRTVHRFLAACPALLLLGFVLCMAYAFLTAIGWDALGYALMLFLSIAPAAGCTLGWAMFGLHQLYKRGDVRG